MTRTLSALSLPERGIAGYGLEPALELELAERMVVDCLLNGEAGTLSEGILGSGPRGITRRSSSYTPCSTRCTDEALKEGKTLKEEQAMGGRNLSVSPDMTLSMPGAYVGLEKEVDKKEVGVKTGYTK